MCGVVGVMGVEPKFPPAKLDELLTCGTGTVAL